MQNLTSKIDEICQVDIHLGFMDFTCRQTGLRLYHTNASYRHHSITVLKIISYPILYFNVWNSRYWRNFNICLLSQLCQPLFSTQMTTCKLQYDWSSIFPDFLGLPLEFSSLINEKYRCVINGVIHQMSRNCLQSSNYWSQYFYWWSGRDWENVFDRTDLQTFRWKRCKRFLCVYHWNCVYKSPRVDKFKNHSQLGRFRRWKVGGFDILLFITV